MKTFLAKFAGHCRACGGRIQEGDEVRYENEQIRHHRCEDAEAAEDDFSLRPGETVCSRCFLVHPGECD